MPYSNNKRIAKNTILLYLRMVLSVLVTLYTSRVVLQVLGVDDYGIYGIVGGVVSMFTFLNATMSGATSRFITYAIGTGDEEYIRDVFSTSLQVHFAIAMLIVILAETIGLWILETKLVIPLERMSAARIVYQLSTLSLAVQVAQVPYNGSIIAYEHMNVFAYVELLNVFLKLGIVYLLIYIDCDKLILYALLLLLVNILIALIYRIYCLRKISTCHYKRIFNKDLMLPMLSYSGWDLYGNVCSTLRGQGINILINMFFGVALNAASSVASSVRGVVSNLSSNVIQAFRPQIIKSYAQGNFDYMNDLVSNAAKYTLLLFMMLCIPLTFEIHQIMRLWLVEVPSYATEFSLIMLWTCPLNLINSILCITIHATGKVKKLSLYTGTILLATVPLVYVTFKWIVREPIYAYVISILIMVFVILANSFILREQTPELKQSQYFKSVIRSIGISLLACIPVVFIQLAMDESILRLFITFALYISMLALLSYYLVLDKNTRQKIYQFLKSKVNRNDKNTTI